MSFMKFNSNCYFVHPFSIRFYDLLSIFTAVVMTTTYNEKFINIFYAVGKFSKVFRKTKKKAETKAFAKEKRKKKVTEKKFIMAKYN